MASIDDQNAPKSETQADNITEFTVSELSFALKSTVEDAYGHVRVRGELGRISKPGSGHIYLDLKDDKSVIAGVIWRGVASKLKIQPEQGLEVIATGKLTTYPGQSKYQIVIEALEPAGAGALMALLEERRKKLSAEGLFDEARKQLLPYLPRVIGVVTSPSGAVIRDIIHRLEDRFPVHVLVWPVRVQGESSPKEVAAAIRGFNNLPPDGKIPIPDLIIVARGGGSVEDLWGFNDEDVVRAASTSMIPLISAVGHETDWTLIDHAADMRAPTPTGAAEFAVPVRTELVARLEDNGARLKRAIARVFEDRSNALKSAMRGLPRLDDLLALPSQRLDNLIQRMTYALISSHKNRDTAFHAWAGRLSIQNISRRITESSQRLADLQLRFARLMRAGMAERVTYLRSLEKLLASLNYQNVLERGFALVRSEDGAMVSRAAALGVGDNIGLEFFDGRRQAQILNKDNAGRKKKPAKTKDEKNKIQGKLL